MGVAERGLACKVLPNILMGTSRTEKMAHPEE
jgi:hypothetical protein